jgi:hypothetical protein
MAQRNTHIRSAQIGNNEIFNVNLNTEVAGNGLAGAGGSALSVDLEGSSLAVSGTGLKIAALGVTASTLAADVVGNGLTGANGSEITVQAEDGSILVGASGVKVGAVDASHLDETDDYAFSGNFTLTTVPTSASDVANKAYVDSVAQGLDVKDSVRLITTANITLSGEQTIDGFLTSTDRVLVNGQTTVSENGIYDTSAGAWTRSLDMSASSSSASVFTFVEEGTLNADNGFVCTNDVGNDTVGTHDLVFVQFSGAGSVIAGSGMTKSGNTLNVIGGTGITANANDIQITDSGVDTLQLADFGVTNTKLGPDAVDGTKIADLSVNTEHLVDNSVETAKINNDAVTTLKIANLNVTTGKIALLAVDTAQLAADAVDGTKLADNAVDSEHYADSSIDESHLNVSNAEGAGLVLSSDGAGGFTWISGTADAVIESDMVKEPKTVVGGETSFTLANTPIDASVQFYLNGLLQEEGVGNDYEQTGTAVTNIVALDANDIAIFYYIINN